VFTLLTSFDGTNGTFPTSIVQAGDGNFYGIAQGGGSGNFGTVFRLTTNGEVTQLCSFNGANGMNPSGRLTLGSDGCVYGTTIFGGDCGGGTVFRVTTNGGVTTLASFCGGTNGSFPQGKLLEVTNGLFYGTATLGGKDRFGNPAYGTMFQMTTNGELTNLATFSLSLLLPYQPLSGVIKATDGNYYGVAQIGGLFCVRPIEAPVLKPLLQGDQMTFSWKAWAGYSYSMAYKTNLNNDSSAQYLPLMSAQTNGVLSYSEPVGLDPQRFYRISLLIGL
jgi:uncharacterized repeat protein (TIGR03803 family)